MKTTTTTTMTVRSEEALDGGIYIEARIADGERTIGYGRARPEGSSVHAAVMAAVSGCIGSAMLDEAERSSYGLPPVVDTAALVRLGLMAAQDRHGGADWEGDWAALAAGPALRHEYVCEGGTP